ncbi:MAG: AbrB/MazE/SpoVT family DNA-binding domain-containing protein [Oscillospiraceae bacterium]|nr:AbrB/MazE/SpoVT family DNA-binding domain-containing protein [Oscillospiraceae bacterium]
MKATGIVRRIDDLGRVVIPKEIRRTMRIREGDPLEIYTDNNGEVIFKKYSQIGELTLFINQYAEILNKTSGHCVIVCDKDHVISVAGTPKRELLERRVSSSLEDIIETRSTYVYNKNGSSLQPIEGVDKYCLVAAPIISSGDFTGIIMFVDNDLNKNISETDIKLIEVAADFLARQMEE